MAIYHFSAKIISRSSGRSATAAAAYRAGEKIVDKRTGEIHDYTRKKGVDSSWISAPKSAPDWVFNREKLWNEVELVEHRRNSQLSREINVALPTELDTSQQLKLVREFVDEQFINKGMVADIACHDLDTHNPHAHIMLTMREIDQDGFKAKKNRDWNKKELLEEQRLAWASHTNKALEIAEVNQTIDHRSLEAQGIEYIPQIHLGVAVNAMRKRGIETEREEQYAEIEAANREIRGFEFHLELINRLESAYHQKSNDQVNPKVDTNPRVEKQSKRASRLSNNNVSSRQQKRVVDIAARFLHLMGCEFWGPEENSENYNLASNSKGLLVIKAKDGRGEILRREGGKITAKNLNLRDVERFEETNKNIDKRLQQIRSEEQRVKKHKDRNQGFGR